MYALSGLPKARKEAMMELVRRWKRTGSGTDVLEEGLRLMSAEKRQSAAGLLAREDPLSAIACTYGRGSRPKLALSKDDASALLRLVSDVNRTGETPAMKSQMVEIAAGIFLRGEKPETLSDPKWKPLLDLIGSLEPGVRQGSLF